jgi:hypothetical protein
MENIISTNEQVNAGVPKIADSSENLVATGHYEVTCFDADGNLKWEDTIKNLVMTVGKTDILTNYFTGSSYTAAFYLGLINTGATYAVGDTMSSHGTWTENVNYASATRPAPSWNAASGTARSTTATAFAINGAGGTIAGAFLTTNSTKSGTTGTLFSAGNFTGGDKVVASGDTLNVTYTANIT